jgi:hypothetical protein
MRLILVAFSALLLASCATVPSYEPYAVEIVDQAHYASDETLCRQYALAYHQGLNLGQIGSQAAQGALSNLADAPIAPLAVAAGAAGQGGSEALNQIGITDTAQMKIFLLCLGKKTDADHSALLIDPNG